MNLIGVRVQDLTEIVWENGVRVQNLTEIPAPLRSVHAKESPY